MTDYMDIIYKYEKQGIPYRNRYDDIRGIVTNISHRIYEDNPQLLEEAIDGYKLLKFVKDIVVDGNKCTVYFDEGVVNFSVPSHNYCKSFNADVFGIDDTTGRCHEVTQRILEGCSSDRFSAVTSLCENVSYLLYFHSYIHDRVENNIIDFSRRIIMNKEQYDKLFCYQEINDLTYNEYKQRLVSSEHDKYGNNKFYTLLFLALEKLRDNDIVDTSNFAGRSR